MDSGTSTEDLSAEIKTSQENLLLEIIKGLYSDNKLSPKLKGKVRRIIADCDLAHYTSLHRLDTDESTSTVLGFMHQTGSELTFDEQAELNQAIIQEIHSKLPVYTAELDKLSEITNKSKSQKEQIKELQESIDEKLNTLQEQENEKVELMMEWINHRLKDFTKFNVHTTEKLTMKAKILELKSQILHLGILQNIFTETNKSIKAYSEIHADLKDTIKETEQRIKHFKDIVDSSNGV